MIDGQKVWTSLAQWSDWCFVVARTEADSTRHHGLSYLLVPMDADGVETRPIRQITGTAEFNEVFFDGARTDADLVVGQPEKAGKWPWAPLAFERCNWASRPPSSGSSPTSSPTPNGQTAGTTRRCAQQLAALSVRLRIMRWNSVRSLGVSDSGELMPEAMIHKLYWASRNNDNFVFNANKLAIILFFRL